MANQNSEIDVKQYTLFLFFITILIGCSIQNDLPPQKECFDKRKNSTVVNCMTVTFNGFDNDTLQEVQQYDFKCFCVATVNLSNDTKPCNHPFSAGCQGYERMVIVKNRGNLTEVVCHELRHAYEYEKYGVSRINNYANTSMFTELNEFGHFYEQGMNITGWQESWCYKSTIGKYY